MITPSVSVEDWVAELNKQVRPESNIQIDVYSVSGGVCSLVKTIDKSNIESFNIRESGSVLGFETPSVDINFSIFKDNTGTIDYFKTGRFIRIAYGFFIDGDWEWAIKGVYEISKVSVPSNGLVAKIEANFLRYQALEQTYIYGGRRRTPYDFLYVDIRNYIRKFDNNITVNLNVGTADMSGILATNYPALHNQNVLSVIRSICQVYNCSFRISGYIDANNHYGINIDIIDNRTSPYNYDYSVDYFNQYKKPETTDESNYNFDDTDIREYLLSKNGNTQNTIEFYGSKVNGTFCEIDYGEKPPADEDTNNIYTSFIVKDGQGQQQSGYTISGTFYYGGAILQSTPSIRSDYIVEMTYRCIVNSAEKTNHYSNYNIITIDNPFVSAMNDVYYQDPTNFDHTALGNVYSMFYRYKHSQVAELDYRIDPRLEILDVVEYEKPDGTFSKGFVEEYNMSFQGSFKGTTRILLTGDREYQVDFEQYYTGDILQNKYYYYGDIPTYDGATPTYTLTNNACYSSAVFNGWDSTIEPVEQDWTYVAQYTFTLRTYTEVSSFDSGTAYYQLVQYLITYRPIPHTYKKDPRIVLFYDLPLTSNEAKDVLNAGEGAIIDESTSSVPTTMSANSSGGGDDWQDNYWRIEAGSQALKYRIRVRNRNTPSNFLYLAETNGKLWLSTNSSNAKQFSLGTDLSQYFEYDSVNNKFNYNPNGVSTPITGLYKRD